VFFHWAIMTEADRKDMTSLHKVEIDKKDDATFPHNFNQGYGITAQ
jgi:hypothetical protein